MRAVFALIFAIALSPTAHAAGVPEWFCMDQTELAAKRKSELTQDKLIYGKGGISTGAIAVYEYVLEQAASGSINDQRSIGRFWSDCALNDENFGADKATITATYLEAAVKAGDKPSMQYLAQLYALGAGRTASYSEAFRLLIQSGQELDVAKTAKTLDVTHAPQAEQQAVGVFAEMLATLIKRRLAELTREVVTDQAIGRSLSARVAFHTCPNRAEIVTADEGLDRIMMQQELQRLAQRLPSAGLPCAQDSGKPVALALPLTITRQR